VQHGRLSALVSLRRRTVHAASSVSSSSPSVLVLLLVRTLPLCRRTPAPTAPREAPGGDGERRLCEEPLHTEQAAHTHPRGGGALLQATATPLGVERHAVRLQVRSRLWQAQFTLVRGTIRGWQQRTLQHTCPVHPPIRFRTQEGSRERERARTHPWARCDRRRRARRRWRAARLAAH
jgi:hypothetical protein